MHKRIDNLHRKIIKLLLIFLISTTLSGCWDLIDIEKRTILISAGLDKEGSDIIFTTELSSMFPAIQTKAEGIGPHKVTVKTYRGINFEDVLDKSSRSQPYRIFQGATRIVVFGENYAREDISSYFNRIDRSYEYRKTVLPVVSREPAKDILNFDTLSDLSVGFLIEHTIMDNLYNNNTTLYGQLGNIIDYEAIDEVGYLIHYIGIQDNELSVLGFAAIVNGKMVGILEDRSSRGAVYLINKKFGFSHTLINPQSGENIVFQTIGGKRKISTNYIDGVVNINIDLKLDQILMYQYKLNPISEDLYKELEKQLADKIKNDIEEAIRIAQEDIKYDIYQLALYFRGDHPKIYKNLDWKEEFPKAKVKVTVSSKITKRNLYDPNVKGK